jgi:hypothetical protein
MIITEPVFHGDTIDEGLFNDLFNLRREFGPMTGDFFTEEDGGELTDVGGFGSA